MSSIILLCACGFFVQALLNASKKYSLRYKTGMAFVYNSLLWGLAAFVGTIVTIKSFSWLLRLFSKLEIPWLCITVEFIRESFDLVWGFLDLIKFLPEPDKYLTLYKYFVLSFFFALPFSRIYVSK